MKLIAILLSLWADRKFTDVIDLRQFTLYGVLVKIILRLNIGGQSGWISYVLLTVLPAWVLMMTISILGIFSLLEMVLWAGVLYLCLPADPLGERIEAYLAAGKTGDQAQLDVHAGALIGPAVPASDSERDRAVIRALFSGSNLHVVSLFFWFSLLGIGAALFYKLNWFLAENRSKPLLDHPVLQSQVRLVTGWLSWIPARLLAIAYGFAGKVGTVFSGLFRRSGGAEDRLAANRLMLAEAGLASAGLDDSTICDDEHVQAAWAQVKRANVFLLIALALITVYRWVL